MKITVTKNENFINTVDLTSLIVFGEEATFFLGRSKDCHIHLDDKKISREQSSLFYNGREWSLRNLSSLANIYVNNQLQLTEKNINNGDIITIGDFVLSIEMDEEKLDPIKDVVEETSEEPYHEIVEEDLEQTMTESVSEGEMIKNLPVDETDENDKESVNYEDGTEDEVEAELDAELDSDFANDFNEETNSHEDYSEEEYEDYPVEEYGEEGGDAGESTQVFKGFAKYSLEIFGEFAPYDSFNIENSEIYIGRDTDKCQIILKDPEVSSVHAVIRKSNMSCSLEDLQSGNGTILNGKRINKKEITNGDEFIIGSTTFTVYVGSEFLDSQKNSLMPVEENQVIEVEEVVEVSDEDELDFDESDSVSVSDGSLIGKFKALPPKKRMIYGVVLAALIFLFVPDETTPKKKKKKAKAKVTKVKENSSEKKLTLEEVQEAESLYLLSRSYMDEGKYPEAMSELDKLFKLTKSYKNSRQVYEMAKQGLRDLEETERKRREEEERLIRKKKITELLKEAKKSVEERNVAKSEALFSKIKELDPQNYDVSALKLDLETWQRNKQEKELEETQKRVERKRQEDEFAPARNLYLKEDWYNAVNYLSSFLDKKGMDADLVEKATTMLKESQGKLKDIIEPLMGKANSLKEGEDLKGAYSAYNDVLKYDPASAEALNSIDDIKDILTRRARKIYRDGLVSESLGAYEEAREKFQEVVQIAPEDNEYYIKASDRLKDL